MLGLINIPEKVTGEGAGIEIVATVGAVLGILL
jgi:hypothetical protein